MRFAMGGSVGVAGNDVWAHVVAQAANEGGQGVFDGEEQSGARAGH